VQRGEGLLAGLGSGARLGDRTHDLLEQLLDKRLAPAAVVDGEGETAERWRHALTTIIDTPIPAFGGSLRERAAQTICEMHFLLPFDALDPGRLADALLADAAIAEDERRRAWAQGMAEWSFSHLRGYLQGYIDLTLEHAGRWFVCDYKTNRLDAYDHAQCEDAMIASGYLLQARLYQVALHRHLRHCLPDYRIDTHLGGTAYLFLRGFPEHGVWHEAADPAGIAALDALFAEVEA